MTLKGYRNKKGLTQEQVAKLTDTTPNYIYLLEQSVKTPSVKMMIKLSKVYNCKPVDIFLALKLT